MVRQSRKTQSFRQLFECPTALVVFSTQLWQKMSTRVESRLASQSTHLPFGEEFADVLRRSGLVPLELVFYVLISQYPQLHRHQFVCSPYPPAPE